MQCGDCCAGNSYDSGEPDRGVSSNSNQRKHVERSRHPPRSALIEVHCLLPPPWLRPGAMACAAARTRGCLTLRSAGDNWLVSGQPTGRLSLLVREASKTGGVPAESTHPGLGGGGGKGKGISESVPAERCETTTTGQSCFKLHVAHGRGTAFCIERTRAEGKSVFIHACQRKHNLRSSVGVPAMG